VTTFKTAFKPGCSDIFEKVSGGMHFQSPNGAGKKNYKEAGAVQVAGTGKRKTDACSC